ncbi:MAG TPA: sensor histidine kinase [Firmicutes bacterium]|nr:sensor histidine kinase [Bacillota bacterium]
MNFLVLDPEYCILSNLYNPQAEKEILQTALIEKLNNAKSGVFLDRINNRRIFVAFNRSKYTGLTTVGTVPIDYVVENTNFIKNITILACILCLAICLVLAYFMARTVSQPINELVRCMRQVEAGDLETRVEFSSSDEIGLLGKNFNKMVARLNYLVTSITEKQERLKQAEIKALQAQINPHFLYNTLDGIRSEALIAGVEKVADMTEALATFFRYTISKVENLVTVEEELDNCNTYFKIQQYRFGNRLQLCVETDKDEDIMHCLIPKLTLQPILENSIIHGTELKIGTGVSTIHLEKTQSRLLVRVSDNGVGMDEKTLEALNRRLGKSGEQITNNEQEQKGGIALYNVNNRIRLIFGEEYGLHIYSIENVGTDVEITIPAITSEREIKRGT